jgi:hypothetical protein
MRLQEFRPRGVHLVGSVPLENAASVYRMAGAILGSRLARLSDGETGERTSWIHWQASVFATHPGFEPAEAAGAGYSAGVRVRLRDGVDPSGLRFGALGYARTAQTSFAGFARAEDDGEIPPGLRFQVSLPTPLAPVSWFVEPGDRASVEPAYEEAMLREVREMASAIPKRRLAVQWDVAVEIALLEGILPAHFSPVESGIVERLVRLANATPPDVELGFHFCYGDAGHEHFKQPDDLAKLVGLANAITPRLRRPLDWLHVPVPRDRDDHAYFAPLAGLELAPTTRLHLGLVHRSDGVAGARRRIAAARRFVEDFGVGTECGLGRRPPETIPDLLTLHAEIADPLT